MTSGASNANDSDHKSKKRINIDSPYFAPTSVGGLTIIFNIVFANICHIEPSQLGTYYNISPLISAGASWLITYLWKAYGRDPEHIQSSRTLKRAIRDAKKQLNDPNISDEEKNRIRDDYDSFNRLLRNHGINKVQSPNTNQR